MPRTRYSIWHGAGLPVSTRYALNVVRTIREAGGIASHATHDHDRSAEADVPASAAVDRHRHRHRRRRAMRPASVLVAESQRLAGEALVAALAQHPGCDPIRHVAVTARAAVELAGDMRPEVVVVDHWIGTFEGLEATAAIRGRFPHIEVLVMSGLPAPAQVQAALSAGAAGFLPKSIGVATLAEAIVRVYRGESPVFMEELWRMVTAIDERAQQSDEVDDRLATLSDREQGVVRLLVEGHSPRDLPDLLFLTQGTVRNHLHKILRKTGAENLQDLLRLARNGAPVAPDLRPSGWIWEPLSPSPADDGISVFVADEQRLVAEALGQALVDVHDLVVLGAVSTNGVDALQAVIRTAPRVFVCDYWMPATSARAIVRYLARWSPYTRVLFVSWLHGDEQIADAMSSGAAGLVTKGISFLEMVNTIRDAAARRPLRHAATLSRRYDATQPSPDERDELVESLSPRELEVLQLVGMGWSFGDIAGRLGITEGTAKNHLSKVFQKTGTRTRLEAVERARRAGYVREPGTPPAVRPPL